MLKQPIKRIFLFLSFFSLSALFTTCGLEEYYYLPQVPEINIITELNTQATINLPSLSGYYYAQNYKIFYRIYISDFQTSSSETSVFSNINSTLVSDYSAIYPNTDPTSTSMGTSAGTLFSGRNYYELELYQEDINNILSTSGGNIRILFPTAQGSFPVLSINNGPDFRLYRSSYFLSINSSWNTDEKRFFRNTSDINVSEYADVVPRTGLSQTYAYVSMYIVAYGTNPSTFTNIYSKPTHICVFRLPDN